MQTLDETPREKWAGIFGITITVIPAMITAGFMPDWNVLPFTTWLMISTAGAALAGAIAAAPNWGRGAATGAMAGAGAMLGLWAYVAARGAITGNHTFLKLELVIGALLGAAPGMALYGLVARPKPPA